MRIIKQLEVNSVVNNYGMKLGSYQKKNSLNVYVKNEEMLKTNDLRIYPTQEIREQTE